MDLKFGRYFSLTQIIFLLELIYFAMQKYFYYIKYICIGVKISFKLNGLQQAKI